MTSRSRSVSCSRPLPSTATGAHVALFACPAEASSCGMKTERWRAGSTLAVALNSTGTGPRSGMYSWYQPSAPPLDKNAPHCSSSLLRSLGGVKSSIVRQGISSRAIPSRSHAAAFPVTQRRWSSAISIGCRDRSNAVRRRTAADEPDSPFAMTCAFSPLAGGSEVATTTCLDSGPIHADYLLCFDNKGRDLEVARHLQVSPLCLLG